MTDADQILNAMGADAALNAHHDAPLWEEPVPLATRATLPTFPADALPGWVADQVTAVAEFTQTPLDLAGSIALAALSTAAGGRAIVNVWDAWIEPVNIFTVVAMPPGSRKSPVFRAMIAPLLAAQTALTEQVKPQIIEAEQTRRIAVETAERAAHTAAAARSGGSPDALAEATSAALAVDAIQVPVKPRLIADDITPEKAATLLAEQGGRLAVLSAEGGIFATLAGRYSGVANLDLFLKGHAGDTLIVDRHGRPTEYVEHAALTLGLAVQPDVITEIAGGPGFRGKGLLGRILYALPPNNIGYRETKPAPMPPQVTSRYDANLQELVTVMYGWEDPARLTLSPEADAVFTDQRRRTEPRLRPNSGDLAHIADWASKYDGTVARIAALLHLAAHVQDGWRRPIDVDTMRNATRIGEYYIAHALAAFDAMGADPDVDNARTVLTWLENNQPERFTVRELFTVLPRSRFKRVGSLEPPLDLLEQHGWIRRQAEPPRNGPGRPPSPTYVTHPRIHQPGA
ncbi:YfjI family protein [Actinoallomurus sp. CA-142502]|uniref:YfjI family protein n=1 Tax=Actinoallomurus sp. CA-142502 TaxID=3239885 RepID=UPI003D927A5A